MPKDTVEFQFNVSGMEKLLNRVKNAKAQLEAGFERQLREWAEREVFPYIEHEWPRSFWDPLSLATLEDKERKGYGGMPALVRTGELFLAATTPGAPGNIFEVTPYSVKIGVDDSVIPYAKWQYFGTPKARYPIPPRPWDLMPDGMIPPDVIGDWHQRLLQRTRDLLKGK